MKMSQRFAIVLSVLVTLMAGFRSASATPGPLDCNSNPVLVCLTGTGYCAEDQQDAYCQAYNAYAGCNWNGFVWGMCWNDQSCFPDEGVLCYH